MPRRRLSREEQLANQRARQAKYVARKMNKTHPDVKKDIINKNLEHVNLEPVANPTLGPSISIEFSQRSSQGSVNTPAASAVNLTGGLQTFPPSLQEHVADSTVDVEDNIQLAKDHIQLAIDHLQLAIDHLQLAKDHFQLAKDHFQLASGRLAGRLRHPCSVEDTDTPSHEASSPTYSPLSRRKTFKNPRRGRESYLKKIPD